MAYSEALADRVREHLSLIPNVQEKRMFGGLCFMVNGKMCVTVGDHRLMCRIDPARRAELIARGATPVFMGGREYKGYLHVDEGLMGTSEQLDDWIGLALAFNRSLV